MRQRSGNSHASHLSGPSGGLSRVLPILAVLLVTSAGILTTTYFAGKAVRTLAVQSLESTARGISLAAAQILREQAGRGVEFDHLFADRVVAYALIADADGKVIFHTNPELRGTILDDKKALDRLRDGTSASRRVLLGTGRPVLVVDHLLQGREGPPALLRLALHTVEADRMIARVSRLWWSVGAVLVLLWAGGFVIVVLSARSERFRLEIERREALSLIGQMTATLAHEIRNAIGGVKGYAQLAAEKTETEDPRAKDLAAVLRGVQRIETLVGDLLLFAREERLSVKPVDLAPLFAAAAAAVPPWPGTLEVEAEPDLRVMADAEKLERVLCNGVRNAVEAMGDTGTLRLTAQGKGRSVEITIEDTGGGLGPETLPKLFTPFYTTKTTGTGLGLAYARKVVEGMGGEITLRNRTGGHGAALIVLLPRAGA